jgi:signal transduction histidine kinase
MEAAVRYSLKALAAQQWTPTAAKELVENVAHRLHLQSEACAALLADLPRHRHSSSKSPSVYRDAERNVRHLLHVHRDTLAQCLQVSKHPRLFLRWSGPDRHDVAALAEEIRTRHAPGLERWVDYSLFAHNNDDNDDSAALDAILRRRWSVQLLCDQLVKLSKGRNAVSVDCEVSMVVQEAYTEASALCDAHWQRSPDLELVVPDNVVGRTSDSEWGIGTPDNRSGMPAAAAGARATVVRPWLHHALVELCKNAMHATVQRRVHEAESRRGAAAAVAPPPLSSITIRVASADDPTIGQVVMIHVEDRGVGLGKDGLSSVVPWAFQIGTSSSSSSKWDRLNVQQSYAPVRSPLNSLGVGLPVSRMMMRHVGGDVALRPRTDDGDNHGDNHGGPGCVATITLPLDTTILEPSVCIAG